MLLYLQLEQAVEATKSVGLATTLLLILFLAVVAGFGFIIRWLIKRSDKRDEESDRKLEEFLRHLGKKDEELIRQMDARREDILMMKASIGASAEAVKDGARDLKQAFADLALEVRRSALSRRD